MGSGVPLCIAAHNDAGSPETLARKAHARSVRLAEINVVATIGVPARAVRFGALTLTSQSAAYPSGSVHCMGDRLEMVWIDALPIATGMIKFQAVWDGAAHPFPNPLVSKPRFAGRCPERPVAVPVQGSSPDPATGIVDFIFLGEPEIYITFGWAHRAMSPSQRF